MFPQNFRLRRLYTFQMLFHLVGSTIRRSWVIAPMLRMFLDRTLTVFNLENCAFSPASSSQRDPTVIELLHQVTHCNTKVELVLASIEASEQEERFWAIWWGGLGAAGPHEILGFFAHHNSKTP